LSGSKKNFPTAGWDISLAQHIKHTGNQTNQARVAHINRGALNPSNQSNLLNHSNLALLCSRSLISYSACRSVRLQAVEIVVSPGRWRLQGVGSSTAPNLVVMTSLQVSSDEFVPECILSFSAFSLLPAFEAFEQRWSSAGLALLQRSSNVSASMLCN
jgi:hypothetical protein